MTHRTNRYRGKSACEAGHVVRVALPPGRFPNLERGRGTVQYVRCSHRAKHVLFRDSHDHTGVLLCDECLPQMIAVVAPIAVPSLPDVSLESTP